MNVWFEFLRLRYGVPYLVQEQLQTRQLEGVFRLPGAKESQDR